MPEMIPQDEKPKRLLRRYVVRVFWLIAGALLATYLFLALRFVTSYPTPTVNYLEQLNRSKLAVPAADRAWLIYRKAILGLGDRNYSKDREDELTQIFDARPGSEHWAKVGPWLTKHADVVEKTRLGAAKPSLGFILGRNGSINDPQVYPNYKNNARGNLTDDAIVSVVLPHLTDLKELAQVLAADARFAREQRDPARLLRDIDALLKLADQVYRDDQFVVEDIVAIGIRQMALEQAEASLLDPKCKLSDDDLRKLAQKLSKPKVAADLVSLAGERLMIQDVVQRCYTDDGSGDGHLTLEGQRLLMGSSMGPPVHKAGSESLHGAMITLLTPALSASRKNVLEHYGRMMDAADANLKRPMREANWQEYEQGTAQKAGDFEKMRQPVMILMTARLANAQERAEKSLGYQDGLVIAIGLELWRRSNGELPKTLNVLVPEFLESLPADRITGDPVKYKLLEGKPLIYSVGADRDDDGGRPPTGKNGWIKAVSWRESKQEAANGDWLLFPQRPEQTP
jgi:hypothetical protein